MSRPVIVFAGDLTDVVTAVIIPMDGFTRRVVTTGVEVDLWDTGRATVLPQRLVRNLSGYHVLLNEPADRDLTFRVRPHRAGYQGPVLVAINPAADGIARVVPLARRPDSDFGDVATLIRGTVVRAGEPVPGVRISARPPAPAGHQFPVVTDVRGIFALAVRLGEPGPVPVVLAFEEPGAPARELTVDLDRGRAHVFAAPIPLDAATVPAFTHQIRP